MILGGYGQFATGLTSTPTPLDIRFNKCIQKIQYSKTPDPATDEPPVTITCADGETLQADAVVVTASLGILKAGDIKFEPDLPERKKGAISRLGFGLLNKVRKWKNSIDGRLCLYMIIHSGIQIVILLDHCGLLRTATGIVKNSMKLGEVDST